MIQFGFHAMATAAPSAATAIALVLTGWTTFALWWKWLAAAPCRPGAAPRTRTTTWRPRRDAPAFQGPAGANGDDIDWDAFEREFASYVDRSPERPLAPD